MSYPDIREIPNPPIPAHVTSSHPICGHIGQLGMSRMFEYHIGGTAAKILWEPFTLPMFSTHLFACPETKLHTAVTFAALVLWQRLKARFPTARGSSGHRLFISAFMIPSKVICDDTYSNKSRGLVGQGMFQLREVNQMKREMCQYPDWELNVEPLTLAAFEQMVRKDFAGPGPYPVYILQNISKLAATTTLTVNHSTSPIPCFGPRTSTPPNPSCPRPTPPSPVRAAPPPPYAPISPPSTPEASYSDSTSPASSASPATPAGYVDDSIKIAAGDDSSLLVCIPQRNVMEFAVLKQKMFAFATTSKW
ncbi:hypothetical protein FIBSPDRAFT_980257 [Athelia psychrophila]|uniref:Uncharacterized protein n=1 Tax=Athelia psychrophila TaxID=1759441 RepID=A0A166D609_9AGAM|nr:hypothetical protein FIBSPDRAFT_980257 [Fibularhizoctonia sp. CBS 109695]